MDSTKEIEMTTKDLEALRERQTESFIVYAQDREDALTFARALMSYDAAQIDVYRYRPGQWVAYIVEVAGR